MWEVGSITRDGVEGDVGEVNGVALGGVLCAQPDHVPVCYISSAGGEEGEGMRGANKRRRRRKDEVIYAISLLRKGNFEMIYYH